MSPEWQQFIATNLEPDLEPWRARAPLRAADVLVQFDAYNQVLLRVLLKRDCSMLCLGHEHPLQVLTACRTPAGTITALCITLTRVAGAPTWWSSGGSVS